MNEQEVRQPDFPGLQLVPDPVGGARIAQNCDLYKSAQLDSRGGYRHANHRRYIGGVYAIIDVQRICDYGRILVFSDTVFEHEEVMAPGWGGPVGRGGGGGDAFWDRGFPPVAIASANPEEGLPPLAVQFSSAGSHDPDGGAITYWWDFDDGTPGSSDANPLHIYNDNGEYTARLTVTDNEGRTAQDTVDIDTRDIIVADSNLANAFVSENGGLNWNPVVGIPAGNTRHVLGANGFIFAFRQNGVNVDVYRSEDGLNYVQVGAFAGTLAAANPILGYNNRILCPVQTAAAQSAVAYSDNDGVAWTVVVIAGPGVAPALCRMTTANRLMFGRQHLLGAGNPYQFYLSNTNGNAWALTAGGFGDSVGALTRLACFAADRVLVNGTNGIADEVHTSDDLGITWPLRQTLVGVGTPRGVWASGTEGVVEDGGFANAPWWSANTGILWANFVGWGAADMLHMIGRSSDYLAGCSNGLWRSVGLPNWVLLGTPGGWLYTIATLRDQET